ncbi:MAG: VanZ family protein, partial [Candidatus Firestonebacteria bacterium]
LFEFIPNSDKLAHMTEYFILSSLTYFALRRGHNMKITGAIPGAVLLAAIYGMLDEYHQYFVPGRSLDILDWFADLTGAFCAHFARILIIRFS